MSDTRIGRQTPTNAVVLPYEDTKGGGGVINKKACKIAGFSWS